MTLNVGDNAPNFTLRASDKSEVSLSDFKGKNVVILFYPAAFTSVCTEELCSTRDSLGQYNQMNAEVLAISVDSVFTLEKFKAEQNLNFHLLSDFNKEVSRAYGSIYEDWILDMKGVSKRSVFVVDGEGKIAYSEVLENAGDMPDLQAAKDAVAALN